MIFKLLLLFLVLFLSLSGFDAQKRNFSHQPCPKNCVCFRRTIRCMQLQLAEIPKVPAQTILLDLRFNKVRSIEPGFFKSNHNIRSLLLNNNQLTSLKNDAFTGLLQLKHLYLYKNRIKYIDPNIFHGLLKLEHLYLHNNEIEEFDATTFSNLPKLERLFLYNNKIKHIPYGSFANLPVLARLRLDSNALVCDCKIAWLAKMINENSIQVAASCKFPTEMQGKALRGMPMKDFHCKSPEIMEEPQDIEISFGGTATFTCHVEGDPKPNVIWMKDNSEIELNEENRYEVMSDGSLMIKNTQEKDNGRYECMAKNVDGMVKSRQARMVVFHSDNQIDPNNNQFYDGIVRGPENSGKPIFLTTPVSLSISSTTPEIRLPCSASGSPQPYITWSRNGIHIAFSNRIYMEQDGTLVIRPVQPTDYGTYRCDATNNYGRISATAEVVINAAPIFTTHPASQTVELGNKVKFECVAVASPAPEITWYKGQTEIYESNRIFINDDASVLEISDVKESDSGLYVCEARNQQGQREVSATLTVLTGSRSRPPTFVYKPYDVEALVGSTIEVPCKAAGNPNPGVQWRKDGAQLQRTGRWKTSISGNLYLYEIDAGDQGRYECTANNDHGSISASGYITVKEDNHPAGIGIGDKFVKVAFVEAKQEVDKAINKTLETLFTDNEAHNPADLFRIIRYPNAPARELARAAEVYERTLVNIRKHVQVGMSLNATSDFNYKELLSPEHLELVARLSGCMAHRIRRNCTDMCYHSKYRSIDGMCNNLQNPTWGASLTGFRRVLKPVYEDGFSTPIGWNKEISYNGFPKPSSRLVSTTLIATDTITPDVTITHMVMQWGQFLDHDLDHAIPSVSSASWDGIDCKKSCDYAAPCYPIDIPPNDPRVNNRRCIDFVRSSSICGSGMTSVFFDKIQPREQINQLTSFIDASQVYGFSEEVARDLRDTSNELGRLREGVEFPGRKPMLPYTGGTEMDCRRNLSESSVNCFVAGDIRANEQVGLLAMHTIWLREHNRVAKQLRFLNPHWEGDMIYQEARKMVGAAMQHITYKHWLPHIIGPEGLNILGEYKEYNPQLNPSISNVFATAALRFGHTLINPILHRLDANFNTIPEGNLPLHKAFFSPWRIVDEGGVDPLLRGLFTVAAKLKKPDQNLNKELTEHLFESAHAVALDLAAINIHRSRDHAIPGYNDFRRFCNLSFVERFEDLRNEISDSYVLDKLRNLYGHPSNIDVWVGGVLEDQVAEGRVGPLFRCLLIDQFRRLRDGDRFWYESPSVFKPEQLIQIKQYNLARVLCDNGDNITRATKDSFLLPDIQGGYLNCTEIPRVDMSMWSECCSDCRYSGQLNTISRLNSRGRRDLYGFSEKIANGTIVETRSTKDTLILKERLEEASRELEMSKKKIDEISKLISDIEKKLNM